MINVQLFNPTEFNRDEWRQLQEIERDAYGLELVGTEARDADGEPFAVTQEHVDELVGWNYPVDYFDSHIEPNNEVGRRYNANQEYTKPRVAVAMDDGVFIGFGQTAHNVSGGGPPQGPHDTSFKAEAGREIRRLSIIKNHLWVRDIVVHPEYWNDKVAKDIGRELLRDGFRIQPVDFYWWPDVQPEFIGEALARAGMRPVPGDERPVKIFGDNSQPVRQVHMQGKTVMGVRHNLRKS